MIEFVVRVCNLLLSLVKDSSLRNQNIIIFMRKVNSFVLHIFRKLQVRDYVSEALIQHAQYESRSASWLPSQVCQYHFRIPHKHRQVCQFIMLTSQGVAWQQYIERQRGLQHPLDGIKWAKLALPVDSEKCMIASRYTTM